MRTILRIALVLLPLGGAAVSYLLLAMQGPAGAPLVNALCAPTAKFDCTSVLASSWGRIGILPTSAWGLIYFAFLAVWFAAIGLPNRRGRWWHLVPTLTACIGIAISAWLVHAMATRLPAWCVWCLVSHGINLLLLIACLLAWMFLSEPRAAIQSRDPRFQSRDREGAGAAMPAGRSEFESAIDIERPPHAFARDAAIPAEYPSFTRVGIVCGTFVGILLLGGLASFAAMQSTVAKTWRKLWLESANTPDYIAWRHASAARVEIPIRDDDLARGDRSAPHTVVVFSDFQCPWCRQLDAFLGDVAKRHPHAVRIVFKHYPLNARCNPAIKANAPGQHPFACDAARAAETVRRLGGNEKAAAYHDLLFNNADRFAEKPYESLALSLGINGSDFAKSRDDTAIAQRIAEDATLAQSLGVTSSGVVFLDGRRMSAWQIMDAIEPSRIDRAATMALWDRLLK